MDQLRVERRQERQAKRARQAAVIALGIDPSIGQQFILDRRAIVAGGDRGAGDHRLADAEPQQCFDLDLIGIEHHPDRCGGRRVEARFLIKHRMAGIDRARRIFPEKHGCDTPSLKWQCVNPQGRS
jgi:hypothetical protein